MNYMYYRGWSWTQPRETANVMKMDMHIYVSYMSGGL